MPQIAHRILIACLAALFLLAGATALLYAQGYRLGWRPLAIVKVGAIFVRSFPSNANITLDGKPIARDWHLFGSGTFINGLFPKTYAFELTADGYRPWQCTVNVAPAMVAELMNVVLLPASSTFVLSGPVEDVWVVQGEPVVKKSGDGLLTARGEKLAGVEVVSVADGANELLTRQPVTGSTGSPQAGSTGSPQAGSTGSPQAGDYVLNDLTNGSSTNVSALVRRLAPSPDRAVQRQTALAGKETISSNNTISGSSSSATGRSGEQSARLGAGLAPSPAGAGPSSSTARASDEYLLDPAGAGQLVRIGKNGLSLLDVGRKTLSPIRESATSTIDHAAALPSWLAWTSFIPNSNTSRISAYDRFANRLAHADTVVPGRAIELQRVGDNRLALLQDDHSLYVYDLPGDTLTKVASDVRLFAVVDDGSLIATVGSRSMEILPLSNPKDYARFNIPDAEHVTAVAWYADRQHLFIHYADRTAFLGLDDVSLQNLGTVVPTGMSRYDRTSNTLYFVSDGELLKYEFPR